MYKRVYLTGDEADLSGFSNAQRQEIKEINRRMSNGDN